MASARPLYVCFYKDKDGDPIGHAVSPKNEFSKEVPKDIDDERKETDLAEIFDNFCRSMIGYMDMLPFIAGMGGAITWGIRSGELKYFCEENCESKQSDEKRDIYELKGNKISEFITIDQRAATGGIVSKQVPKMLLIGIVSSLDYHISQLIRSILNKHPGLLSENEKKISIKEVFRSESINEFKDQVLDREIESITRESFEDQIKWFERSLNLSDPIKKDYTGWVSLIEIIERRNLFAHTNGVINTKYIKVVSEASGGSSPKVKKGGELFASQRYFQNALENIFEFGVKLAQVVWRKLEAKQAFTADEEVGGLGYSLLERGEYNLAINVLEFALYTIKGKKDEKQRRMNVVNLANVYSLKGNLTKAKEVLDSEDWGIVSDDFAVSVAAVQGNLDTVFKYMRRLSASGDWDGALIEEWPVFFGIRDTEVFKSEFKKIFGRDFVPQPKDKHKVLQNFLMNSRKQVKRGQKPEKIIDAEPLSAKSIPASPKVIDARRKKASGKRKPANAANKA